jgi:hypothetical protein
VIDRRITDYFQSKVRQDQSPLATPAGNASGAEPRHQLEGASAAVQTLSTPAGPRQTHQPSGCSHCPGTGGLYVGHRQTGFGDTVSPLAESSLEPPLSRFTTSIGRGAAPVWCNPRRRYETARHTRAASEAGTRRMQVRWSPTHGSQRDQPSDVAGSDSSNGYHEPEDLTMQNTA